MSAYKSRARRHSLADKLPSPLALVVLDFDGVLTDDAVYVGEDGKEWVRCSRADGMGIALLQQAGIPIIVLSTEKNPVVSARCKKLRVPCIQACEDKAMTLRDHLRRNRIDPHRVIYVGNDVNDLECLALVGCGVAVADAQPEVLSKADAILTRPGGNDAIRELCDAVLKKCKPIRRARGQ